MNTVYVTSVESVREIAVRGGAPLVGEPPRFSSEVTLPVPAGYTWPYFDCVILASHTCVMRHIWGSMGLRAVSVAERRTILEPLPGCMHVIGDIFKFLATYPHEPSIVDSHLTCGFANNASHASWPQKVADGSMLRSALEAVDVRA